MQFGNPDVCTPTLEVHAAIKHLESLKYDKQILIYYGQGEIMALAALVDKQDRQMVKGAVLISGFSEEAQYKALKKQVTDWTLYVLDITAQFDYPLVERAAKIRKRAFAGVPKGMYRSFVLPGAAHDYFSQHPALAIWVTNYSLARIKQGNQAESGS